MQIVYAFQRKNGLGRFAIAAPGAAIERVAVEQILAATRGEGIGVIAVKTGFDMRPEAPFRVRRRGFLARPAEGDRNGGYRASGFVVTGHSFAKRFPSAQDQIGGFDGQEALGKNAAWPGKRRKQSAQSLYCRAMACLAQSVFD